MEDLPISFIYDEPHHVMCWTRKEKGCSFCISICHYRYIVQRNTHAGHSGTLIMQLSSYAYLNVCRTYTLFVPSRQNATILRFSTSLIAGNSSTVKVSRWILTNPLLQEMFMKYNCENCSDQIVWGIVLGVVIVDAVKNSTHGSSSRQDTSDGVSVGRLP